MAREIQDGVLAYAQKMVGAIQREVILSMSKLTLHKFFDELVASLKGKPAERQGRKASGLRAIAYDSGAAVYRKGECIRRFSLS
jgi:hypothetical protein